MIELLQFSAPKRKTLPFIMSDYIELLCICNPDNEISKQDALVRVYNTSESETEHETELDEGITDETAAEYSDRQQRYADDWFAQLAFRVEAFDGFYPFYITGQRLIVHPTLTNKMKTYLFLLLCSSLRIIADNSRHYFTSDFEILSSIALRKYLPKFTVHPFGKSPIARENYSNKLFDAIKELCSNIMERNICEPNEVASTNTGDGGLDIVAWRTLNDYNAHGNLICFAQCACQPEGWENKLYDSHFDKWRKRISFSHQPAQFIFIPICFRKTDGTWFDTWKIGSGVVMDRLRICLLLQSEESTLNHHLIVDSFIDKISEGCPT